MKSNNNNYNTTVTSVYNDKESSGNSRKNNFMTTMNNEPLMTISEMHNYNSNSNETESGNNYYNKYFKGIFDKNKQFLSPQKLQETSPIFYNPGDMKVNSNSLANEKEKRSMNNNKDFNSNTINNNIFSEFKNFAFGLVTTNNNNNFNKPKIDSSVNLMNSPNNSNNYGNLTTQKNFNTNIKITNNNNNNNMNNTLMNTNNNIQNINNLNTQNYKNNKKQKQSFEKDISKSLNFTKKIKNNPLANSININNNKENSDQINDFLKNMIYQNNKSQGLSTVRNSNNNINDNNINDHKRLNSLTNINSSNGKIQNNYLLNAEDSKQSNSLKKLQLPLIK